MFSLTPSELLTIAVVALIIFGPQRLPELARRAGKLVAYLKRIVADVRQEVEGELGDSAQSLKDVAADLDATGKSIKEAATDGLGSITKPFREAASDLGAEGKKLEETVEGELKWVDEDPS